MKTPDRERYVVVKGQRNAGKALRFSRLVGALVAENEQLKSTIRQVSKALCGKENATKDELLQAVNQMKYTMLHSAKIAMKSYEIYGALLEKHGEAQNTKDHT